MQNLTGKLKGIEAEPFAGGGCAKVYRAMLYSGESDRGTRVAVKLPIVRGESTYDENTRKKVQRRWEREIRVCQHLSHPNVLSTFGFCDNPIPDYKEFFGLVLPYCKNGNANKFLARHPETDRLKILVHLAAGLHYLHSQNPPIVHGDIKAENILIDDFGRPLFADFGISRICDTKGFTTPSIMGTYRWMAVELLRATDQDESPIRTTTALDVWAFGMTVFEIMTGKVPFAEYKHDGGVLCNVVQKNVRPAKPSVTLVGDALWSVLEHCWSEDPASRPDARRVGLALDLICGLGGSDDGLNLAAILKSSDAVSSRTRPALATNDTRAYRCKWLHCPEAFDAIEQCIQHERAEYVLWEAVHNAVFPIVQVAVHTTPRKVVPTRLEASFAKQVYVVRETSIRSRELQ
ncbi:kinase-like protein [Phellopilus nigrolimitatus]|nr:kinase-like protein [Phellopilus nigrolimitatus]